jgi:hypothetical protein
MPLAVCTRRDWSAHGGEPYDGPSLTGLDTLMKLIATEWRDTVNRHFALYHGAARVSAPDVSLDMLQELLLEHVFADTWHDVKLAEEEFFGD